jgi:muramoyltetrapeptide carboxypeptidase
MAGLVKPEALKKGDTIAIVAPASPGPKAKLDLGVKRLEQAGFKVYVHPQCYKKRGYLAGDDRARARALMQVFTNGRYKAVVCARGGMGCYRLLKHLDLKIIRKHPKIFVGFSDITILHNAFQKDGFVTFHGAMPSIDICRKNYHYNLDNWMRAIMTSKPLGRLQNPRKLGSMKKYHGGKAKGVLVGGNISLLDKLVGTEYMPSFKNKIVLLEDTDEEPYRIDGYLGHMFEATDIAKAAGFAIGEWVNVRIRRRNYPSLTLEQVFDDYFKHLKVPILTNVACGHGKNVLTIPLGVRARIDADNGSFEIIEKAVS